MGLTIHKRIVPAVCSVIAMAVLILDSKTALTGAAEGIDLCLKVVIPSLFPFLILSCVLTASTFGMNLWFLRPLCRVCRIPNEAAPLLLVGLIGGYPVGAQCITRAYKSGQLSPEVARRMLGFCNNAGPAFIFGMTPGLFESMMIPWVLWLIQITAIVMTGAILPGGTNASAVCKHNSALSPAAVLHQAMNAMASICGWVIVFRTGISFCNLWILDLLPQTAQCLVSGILELTNGCCRLSLIPSESLRFLLCAVFLSFGGVAVYMQTLSVTQGLGTGAYLPGKIMQTTISAVLALVISPFLFPSDKPQISITILLPVLAASIIFVKILQIKQNNSRNRAAQSV